MQIPRAYAFVAAVATLFLAPALIPGVGIFDIYFFIVVLVLLAWFSMKWSAVKSLTARANLLEAALGIAVVVALYGYNISRQSSFGILDDSILFAAVALAFYGFRAFKLFWVPTAYGMVLLLGYQVESLIPNYVAMQDWLARLLASAMDVIGVNTGVSGHVVYLMSANGPLALDIQGDCTGLQGILAFGLLSTMALLDVKPKVSRLVPLFAIGFLGAFLINLVRLFMVFLTFEYLGVSAGTMVHVYAGYTLFVVWVLVFWSLAFRYLGPPSTKARDVLTTAPPGGLK